MVWPERIAVVPHGVEPEFFIVGTARSLISRICLCVSTLHPHKNLERLLRTFAVFRRELARSAASRSGTLAACAALVLAGMRGFQAAHLEKLAGELGLWNAVSSRVGFRGKSLYYLFRGAAAFVYPSTFEGFGMPVLEAWRRAADGVFGHSAAARSSG